MPTSKSSPNVHWSCFCKSGLIHPPTSPVGDAGMTASDDVWRRRNQRNPAQALPVRPCPEASVSSQDWTWLTHCGFSREDPGHTSSDPLWGHMQRQDPACSAGREGGVLRSFCPALWGIMEESYSKGKYVMVPPLPTHTVIWSDICLFEFTFQGLNHVR